MPPKLPLTNKLLSTAATPFICPSCRHKKSISTYNGIDGSYNARKSRGFQPQRRSASTTPSVTAVNVKREIPSTYQELYGALKTLESDAGVYVNTSQLQLALRGLEAENAITRIAVLGLRGHAGARRLTKALLADPLAAEPGWEKQLTGADEGDGKALLLRYAENTAIDDRHPLVRTLSIPSPILQNHQIEILVHTMATQPANDDATSFLVPSLEIPNSASGRPATVTYPVHKALIYWEGLNELGTFATLDAHANQGQERRMFKGVIDWSWSTSQQGDKSDDPVSPINLALAEAAIETFRKSLDKSIEYEHMWFDAGMPALSSWLLEGTETQAHSIKSAVSRLIQAICTKAHEATLREADAQLQQEKASAVPITTKNILNQDITTWAENAHTELRDRLNAAFASTSWKKTKWWKLFWRADDVGYIATEILQRAWLLEAEKEMIWICGRLYQSGLLDPPKLRPTPRRDPNDEAQTLGGTPSTPSTSDLLPTSLTSTSFTEPPPTIHPWPQDISLARTTLSSISIPPLQALSQSLILQTLSTNLLTSSLSALLYISVSTTSPYEAGAIAATGLVFSLRRLQRRWERARGAWEVEVREEGRRVLRRVEGGLREGVVDNSRPEADVNGKREREGAREAVGRVEEALERVRSRNEVSPRN